jgi:hypothetical protein
MRVLITGSRTWDDAESITAELAALPPGTTIVHGGCPTGADAIAHQYAVENGIPVEVYPADWDEHGRAAGPIRNAEMIATMPDLVLAFVRGDSPGTRGCVRAAISAEVPVRILDWDYRDVRQEWRP